MAFDKLRDYLWPEGKRTYQFHLSLCVSRKNLHLYRICCFLFYYIPSLIFTWIIGEVNFIDHFFFFTNWGHLACMTYFGLASWLELRTPIDSPPQKGFLWKFTHILFELSFSMEFTIAVFFWSLLAPPYFESIKDDPHFAEILSKNILLHAVTPLTVWIELSFNYVEFHWRHCLVFLPIVTLCYNMLNALGVLVFKIVIYQPVIDWESFQTALLLVLGLVLGFIGFGLGVCLHNLKIKRFEKKRLLVEEEDTPTSENYENVS